MMPLAAFVPLSGSNSNHSSSRSADDCVISFEMRYRSCSDRLAPYCPSFMSPRRSRQLIDDGSGGTSPMIGLIAFAARAITRAYSS
jgi:hypothetical protein